MERILWTLDMMNSGIAERIYGRRVEFNRVVGSMSYLETSDIKDIVLIITVLKYQHDRHIIME